MKIYYINVMFETGYNGMLPNRVGDKLTSSRGVCNHFKG